jgi:hypothetical protein
MRSTTKWKWEGNNKIGLSEISCGNWHREANGLESCAMMALAVSAPLAYVRATLQPETTQQSGQTPDKEVEIKNITVYVSCYSETDTTGMLSPPTVWRQQSECVSEPTVWPHTCCSAHGIRVSLQWIERI